MKISIIESILAINPNAIVNVTADDVNKIEWLENTQVISNEIILDKQNELQQIEDNKVAQELSNKQSALKKLSSLGLTEEEIKAILK